MRAFWVIAILGFSPYTPIVDFKGLTDYDGDIPALIPEKYFLMVNFDAL